MKSQKHAFEDAIKEVQSQDEEFLVKTEELERAWSYLVFEGKSSWVRNLKRLDGIRAYLSTDFIAHMKIEEEIIFPFINAHVPRMKYPILALCSDHDDFRRDIDIFGRQLEKLKATKTSQQRSEIVRLLHDTVIYLIHLLRHHVQIEKEGVFRVVNEELTASEKKELIRNFTAQVGQIT